jgi:hypothetical protein
MAKLTMVGNIEALRLKSKKKVLYLQQCFKLDKTHIYQLDIVTNEEYSEYLIAFCCLLTTFFQVFFILFTTNFIVVTKRRI